MPRAHPITGIAGLTSKTYFNQPPVEWGRADASVATIAVGTATGDDGTAGGTNGTVVTKQLQQMVGVLTLRLTLLSQVTNVQLLQLMLQPPLMAMATASVIKSPSLPVTQALTLQL